MGMDLKSMLRQAQNGEIPIIEETKKEPSIKDGSEISELDNSANKEIIENEKPKRQQSQKTNNSKKGKEEINTKKSKASDSIVDRIKGQEKSGIEDPMLHIRLKPEIHQKLMLYGIGKDKLSMQSIATFAIIHLLEQEEMKKLLNSIKNGMV